MKEILIQLLLRLLLIHLYIVVVQLQLAFALELILLLVLIRVVIGDALGALELVLVDSLLVGILETQVGDDVVFVQPKYFID